MAIRRNIPYSLLEDSIFPVNNLEFQSVQIHYKNFDLTIFSIYRHPQLSLSRKNYFDFFEFCDSFSHTLLLGNFNALVGVWDGCPRAPVYMTLLFSIHLFVWMMALLPFLLDRAS